MRMHVDGGQRMTDRTAWRAWWLVPIAVYVASIAVFVAWSPLNLTAFPLDDAWIHRVYARAFAHGDGFAYNPGEQTTGFTSPLWVLITAPVHWLEPLGIRAPVVGVKVIGAVLGALTVGASYRIAAHASRSVWPAVVAATAVACQPVLAFSVLAGMETVLLLALWAWLVVAIQERRFSRGAILLGLLPVARPEGIVLGAVAVVAVAIAHRRELRAALRTRAAIVGLAWMIVPTLLWIVYCLIVSGHPLPATYYLKARGAMTGEALANLGTLLTEHGLTRSLPLVVIGASALVWTVRARPAVALFGGGSLLFVVAILATRTFSLTGYYWTRWTDPGVLGFTSASMIAVALAANALVSSTVRQQIRWIASGAVAVVVLFAVPGLVRSMDGRATRFASDASVIERMNVAPGRWISEHVPAGDVVGVNDAGALRYFGERETIDVFGLNNLDVAFKRVPSETIAARLDWLAAYPVVTSTLATLVRFKTVMTFQVPLDEYTICVCPEQTLIAISQRADTILTSTQRDALVRALRAAGPATAWLAVSPRDADALADAAELRSAFEDAGWTVAPLAQLSFRLRPGLALLAADHPAAPAAASVRDAFAHAGVPLTFVTGYRDQLARDRGPVRIELVADQPFVIAVGRRGP
jgi:hypothetical protein